MPIPFVLVGIAQILFIVHAARTGRPYYWFPILLLVPMLGILAYVLIELVPSAGRSRTALRTVDNAKRIVNPEGRYRKLVDDLDATPTIANIRALADECVAMGRLEEAEQLYRQTLEGLHATDPHRMLDLARVQFARGQPSECLATLTAIKDANPQFQSQAAHMLYARGLEDMARTDEALAEYQSLGRYFSGEEPRVRRGLLLQKLGDQAGAAAQFSDVIRSVERSPSFYRRNQAEWYRLARQNLSRQRANN
jgi:hypothetical protein